MFELKMTPTLWNFSENSSVLVWLSVLKQVANGSLHNIFWGLAKKWLSVSYHQARAVILGVPAGQGALNP